MIRPLRIGTRGSRLALWQAHAVRDALAAQDEAGPAPDIVVIRTSGDRFRDRPLRELGGKGLFTKEIEDALLEGHIDLAVHSVKDMPTLSRPGLALAACLARADVRDVLIARTPADLDTLPAGARIGTSALRRQAQIRRRRRDLLLFDLRGNVDTRLARVAEGALDAVVLAAAGLKRLGLLPPGASLLPPDVMVPAVGQGAVGIEIRADDDAMRARLAGITHAPTFAAIEAERALLAALNGSCRSPIAGHARFEGDRVSLVGLVFSPDGHELYGATREGPAAGAQALAREAAAEIRAAAPLGFVAAYLSGE